MPAISASAPGKIILFGEHAVVYGRPAIAIPVTQVQAKAIITPRIGPGKQGIEIQAPEIDLQGPLKDLPLEHAIRIAIDLSIKALKITNPPAFTIKVTSSIPLAAGLGSGAAVSVAIVRAVSAFLGKPLENEVINQIAYEVEIIHHGTPSGIDNTVVTYAQPVLFIKDQDIQTFQVPQPFTLVIGDTGIKCPTSIPVREVRKAWEADSETYNQIFDACASICLQGKDIIEKGLPDELGHLMNENHGLLQKMGVSSLELDALVKAALGAGALGAKLSGGGKGGNMIALTTSEQALSIAKALRDAGAQNTIITQVGASS